MDVVVLTLTKHSKAIEDAIPASTVARSLQDRGIDTKPDWACGAKIFVSDFIPEDASELRVSFGQMIGLGPCHVVLAPQDEASVMACLKSGPHSRAMATAKPGTTIRANLLRGDEYFACSSSSASSSAFSGSSSLFESVPQYVIGQTHVYSQRYRVVIKNTFIDSIMENDDVADRQITSRSDPGIVYES